MKIQNPKSKIQNLLEKYPRFVYEKYFYKISGKSLEIFFDFKIESDINGASIKFRPKIIIKNVNLSRFNLDNFIFHLGLMEIPSYWKATCSPLIEIRAGYLNQEQIKWWKKLFIDGMGQFYYENRIDWRKPNFFKIINYNLSDSRNQSILTRSDFVKIEVIDLKDRYLVPFAGGRDSIVTLEGLKKQKKEIALFTVNPIERIQQAVRVTGIKKQIIIHRIIDKKLLELNKRGFLNGHTPITAVLSFLSVFCAVLFGYKNIAFSNEKSANEGNVRYLGKNINHQWAKSSEFEKMFKEYVKKYLAKNINYFSFIRKYGELEISKMLTKYPKYFPVFSSCNAAMRIKPISVPRQTRDSGMARRWCGNCPKCLFVYATLYPFLNKKQMLEIFGKDLFQNKKLLPIMRQLTGERGFKPFECVGTKKESWLAFEMCLKKARRTGKIPYLLTRFQD